MIHNKNWEQLRHDLKSFEVTQLPMPPTQMEDQKVQKTAGDMESQTHGQEHFTEEQQARLRKLHSFLDSDEYTSSGSNDSQNMINILYVLDKFLEVCISPEMIVVDDTQVQDCKKTNQD